LKTWGQTGKTWGQDGTFSLVFFENWAGGSGYASASRVRKALFGSRNALRFPAILPHCDSPCDASRAWRPRFSEATPCLASEPSRGRHPRSRRRQKLRRSIRPMVEGASLASRKTQASQARRKPEARAKNNQRNADSSSRTRPTPERPSAPGDSRNRRDVRGYWKQAERSPA